MKRAIHVPFDEGMFTLAYDHARAAALGGSSHVRDGDRAKRLLRDQVVGQCGELALHCWLFGTDEGMDRYDLRRLTIEETPHVGDDGRDIAGVSIDVKASRVVDTWRVWDYHLLVPEPEYYRGTTYVSAIVNHAPDEFPTVWLMGWWAGRCPGVFQGVEKAIVKKNSDLHPLPPLPRIREGG